MADRFDEVASPLFLAGLMTSRGLVVHLKSHIPVHIHRATLNAMAREDEKRFNEGELLTDKDELMVMAQKKEAYLLGFEAEMRAAGLTPDPRATESSFNAPPPAPRVHRAMQDRLNHGGRDLRDSLGKRSYQPIIDTRECHVCKKVEHVAKIFPNFVATPPPLSRAPPIRTDNVRAHCENCVLASIRKYTQ